MKAVERDDLLSMDKMLIEYEKFQFGFRAQYPGSLFEHVVSQTENVSCGQNFQLLVNWDGNLLSHCFVDCAVNHLRGLLHKIVLFMSGGQGWLTLYR